jgi:hypothetical protein
VQWSKRQKKKCNGERAKGTRSLTSIFGYIFHLLQDTMYMLQSGNQFESTLIDFSKHVFYPKQIKLQVDLLKKRCANIMMTSHVISNDPKLENICSVWS